MTAKANLISSIRAAMRADAAGSATDDEAAGMLGEIAALFAALVVETVQADVELATGFATGMLASPPSDNLDKFACQVIATAIEQAQSEGADPKTAAVAAADAFRAGVDKLMGKDEVGRADQYRAFKRAGL